MCHYVNSLAKLWDLKLVLSDRKEIYLLLDPKSLTVPQQSVGFSRHHDVFSFRWAYDLGKKKTNTENFQNQRVLSCPSTNWQILRVSSWPWSISPFPVFQCNPHDWNKWLLYHSPLILYRRVKFHLAEHSSLCKKMYTNSTKSGKANTLHSFPFMCVKVSSIGRRITCTGGC